MTYLMPEEKEVITFLVQAYLDKNMVREFTVRWTGDKADRLYSDKDEITNFPEITKHLIDGLCSQELLRCEPRGMIRHQGYPIPDVSRRGSWPSHGEIGRHCALTGKAIHLVKSDFEELKAVSSLDANKAVVIVDLRLLGRKIESKFSLSELEDLANELGIDLDKVVGKPRKTLDVIAGIIGHEKRRGKLVVLLKVLVELRKEENWLELLVGQVE